MANKPGRPIKGNSRRIPIMIYIEEDDLKELDNIVSAINSLGENTTRSEHIQGAIKNFINEFKGKI